MSDVSLKSLTFPGLTPRYTVPQVDDTLTVQGAAADAKVTGDAIGEVKSDLDELEIIVGKPSVELEIGNIGLSGSDLNYTTNNVRVRTKQGFVYRFPKGTEISLSNFTNYILRVLYARGTEYTYSDTRATFTLPYDANVALCIWNADLVTPLSVDDAKKLLSIDTGIMINDNVNALSKVIAETQNVAGFESVKLIDSALDANGIESVNNTRICTDYIAVSENEVLSFDAIATKTLKLVINHYTSNDYTTSRTNTPGWTTNKANFMIPSGVNYIRILIAYTDDSVIKTTDFIQAVLFRHSKDEILKSYSVGADMIRRNINMKHLGIIQGLQSFCKYNDKYYSTDGAGGGHVFVQDGSFSLESTYTLNVGHGNSFQLGHNGKAYVSGWDDDKVYVVDLATVTIDSVINLPVTGYTTAAVDDLNGLMYIFSRSSYPDTEANYTFTVYDYDNNQVKSTKILDSFYAMQSCDFCRGKIFVNYGLGYNKNGYMVFNTAGDVIGSLNMDALDTYEPQGVFIDRTTDELLISFTSGHLYSVYGM